MKKITIEVKVPGDKIPTPMVGLSHVLAQRVEGQRLEELGICTVIRSWQDAEDVLNFLVTIQHCFPKPPKE